MIRVMFFRVGILLLSIPAPGFMLHAIVKIASRVCKFVYGVKIVLNLVDDDDDGGYCCCKCNNMLILFSVISEMQI